MKQNLIFVLKYRTYGYKHGIMQYSEHVTVNVYWCHDADMFARWKLLSTQPSDPVSHTRPIAHSNKSQVLDAIIGTYKQVSANPLQYHINLW